jgi:hypothetical protein
LKERKENAKFEDIEVERKERLIEGQKNEINWRTNG